MPEIRFIALKTEETPKKVLERDFPELAPLPIRGGWGYDLSTACIIEPPDDPDIPFDGVGVECVFAEHRVYEELTFLGGPDLTVSSWSAHLSEVKIRTEFLHGAYI